MKTRIEMLEEALARCQRLNEMYPQLLTLPDSRVFLWACDGAGDEKDTGHITAAVTVDSLTIRDTCRKFASDTRAIAGWRRDLSSHGFDWKGTIYGVEITFERMENEPTPIREEVFPQSVNETVDGPSDLERVQLTGGA